MLKLVLSVSTITSACLFFRSHVARHPETEHLRYIFYFLIIFFTIYAANRSREHLTYGKYFIAALLINIILEIYGVASALCCFPGIYKGSDLFSYSAKVSHAIDITYGCATLFSLFAFIKYKGNDSLTTIARRFIKSIL